jgi:3-oxoadipate enol-lactonase
MAAQFIDTTVGKLNVDVTGSGPAILFWPSLFTDLGLWDAQLELASAYRLIRVDGPGHGRSEDPRVAFSMADCARAALEVLDSLGEKSAVVCGTSWGAMVAVEMAHLAPERCRGLVLLNVALTPYSGWTKLYYASIAETVALLGPNAINRFALKLHMLSRGSRRDRPELSRKLLDGVRPLSRKGMGTAARAVIGRTDSQAAYLRDIKVPALFIAGSEDIIAPAAQMRSEAALLPGARFELLQGVAHLAAWEAPTKSTALIRELLDGLGGQNHRGASPRA